MAAFFNILVIRGGALGDFILTLPALYALRKSFPAAHIELMANPSFLPLSRKYIDRGEGIDKNGIWNFFTENGELPEELKNYFHSFKLIILLRPDKEGCFRENLKSSGVQKIVYHNPASPCLKHTGTRINNKHFSIQIMDSLSPLGVTAMRGHPPNNRIVARGFIPRFQPTIKVGATYTANGYKPEIDFTDEDIKFAEEFLPSCERGIVAIHPGSGSEKKNWMVERFAEVAKILSKKGFKIILISGPADKNTKKRFLKLTDFTPVLAENLSIMKLASVIKRCDYYIGNDSGVTHLSALTGVKTIALYGPTDPAVWSPIGKKVTVIKRDCLENVSVKDVLLHL
ncbi:MAG: glycosyltransferase family 9 protein [Nitrospinae bacterium]|nr:glycosyltransferase family 9 protein [Nitrospinota bacterium]